MDRHVFRGKSSLGLCRGTMIWGLKWGDSGDAEVRLNLPVRITQRHDPVCVPSNNRYSNHSMACTPQK
jgi:hypothetical protein